MTKMRGLLHGKMVEFIANDEGPQGNGYGMRFDMPSGISIFSWCASADVDGRLECDIAALVSQGFEEATLECNDGYSWGPMPISPRVSQVRTHIRVGTTPVMSGPINPYAGLNLLPAAIRFLHTPPVPPAPPTPWLRLMKPDRRQPDTLGWRAWLWHDGHGFLVSPHQHTAWPSGELSAQEWTDDGAVRAVVGIHARLVPKHWKIIGWPDGDGSDGLDENPRLVTGIVERFGRYVLGTEGWRAEQVVIRELMAPSTEIGLALEQRYPDVIVHYPDQEEGNVPCESEKSSELERGSRSLLPLTQPSPSPLPRPSLPIIRSVSQSVSPPMLADPALKNMPASIMPGRLTYMNPPTIPTVSYPPGEQLSQREKAYRWLCIIPIIAGCLMGWSVLMLLRLFLK